MVAGLTPSICCFAEFEYVTKPRSRTRDDPAISLIAPATSPPVHDSAVASVSFFVLQTSSRDVAATSVAWSGIRLFPGEADRGGRIGHDAFAAAREAEFLAGGGFHADA